MLQFKEISYTYDKKLIALSSVSFDIARNSFTVICGASGSGKSTLLKIIGGAIKPDSGDLLIFGKNSKELTQKQLDACLVSKEVNYKNKTVYQSLCYGLRLREIDDVEINNRIMSASRLLDLARILHIKIKNLPIHLQQIASLARILVRKPKIALIDCPLDGLNDADKLTVVWAIRTIRKSLPKCTFVYATTEPFEANFFDARLVVLRNSYYLQSGTIKELMDKPTNKFVASYLGAQFLDATVCDENGELSLCIESLRLPIDKGHSDLVGEPLSIAVFPSELELSSSPIDNALKCSVINKTPLGFKTLMFVKPPSQKYLWAIKCDNSWENSDFLYFLLKNPFSAFHVKSGQFIDFSV